MTACVREPFRHRRLCVKAHLDSRLPLTAASTSTRLQQIVNSQQNAVKSSRNYLLLISKRKTITSVDYSKHNTRRSDTRKHQPPHNPVKLSTDHRLISEITGAPDWDLEMERHVVRFSGFGQDELSSRMRSVKCSVLNLEKTWLAYKSTEF